MALLVHIFLTIKNCAENNQGLSEIAARSLRHRSQSAPRAERERSHSYGGEPRCMADWLRPLICELSVYNLAAIHRQVKLLGVAVEVNRTGGLHHHLPAIGL